jgi:SAM-dependent methyltransferase
MLSANGRAGLQLDRVVWLGRTLEEYRRALGLELEQLRGRRVLDVAAGVSSFCAEARERGVLVTACDAIYGRACAEIRARAARDLEEVSREIGSRPVYRWGFYGDVAGMRAYRQRALEGFLADYERNRGRYVPAALPRLPFADGQFEVTLVSYLLFVYQAHLDYEFHLRSVLELLRVTAGEARVYPLVTFDAERSIYLERLRDEPALRAWRFEMVPTAFEFLAGSGAFLRLTRASRCSTTMRRGGAGASL